jgi:hypothetical protein
MDRKRISVSRKGLAELTPEARVTAFQEDLAALNKLAKVVHRKAIEGDNAAGHLDLKIRERKAAMFGYDSPQRYDMTLIVERTGEFTFAITASRNSLHFSPAGGC